jgi:hypothetical protein
MPTPAEEAFSEGFSELAEVHGKKWTFGRASFVGVASVLKPDDPRMAGSADRIIEITAMTSGLPSLAPARGDEISSAGKTYRIIRLPDTDPATGFTSFLAALT